MGSNHILISPIFPILEIANGVIGILIVGTFRAVILPYLTSGLFGVFLNIASIVTGLCFLLLAVIGIIHGLMIVFLRKK